MLKKLMTCVLACLMIFLVACSNTAKEAATDETINETSFPAGNTQAQAEVEQTEEPQTAIEQEITQTSVEESKEPTESKKPETVSTAPVAEKPTIPKATEKPQAEATKQTTETVPETKPEQPKESKPVETEPVEIPTEKPAEPKPTEPKPTEPPKQVFDVSPYVKYAKEYAESIGLSLDSTATECWDNPISANPNRSGIKADIENRLNRYKNSEGFTAVCIWTEKVSDTDYEIYIGYC